MSKAEETLNELMMAIVNHDLKSIRDNAKVLYTYLRSGKKALELSPVQSERLLAQFCALMLNPEVRRQYQYMMGHIYEPSEHC